MASLNNGQAYQGLAAEHSEDLDDSMAFIDSSSNAQSAMTKPSSAAPSSQFGRTATMFINGKPIMVDKKEQALNKREKSNWLVHILFIRQEYD
jgi:hypothetical protein